MVFFPALNATPDNLNSNSWFDLSSYSNNIINLVSNDFTSNYISTYKYQIYPTPFQKSILLNWLDSIIHVYNHVNDYIKSKIFNNNCKLISKYHKYVNFYNLRSCNHISSFINVIKNKYRMNKHTIDYSVKLCVEMYKSAISNLKAKNIKKFNINHLNLSRNRKNLVLEPTVFSKVKNGFCIKELGEMKSDVILKDRISKNCILQYNSTKNTFYILSPTSKTFKFNGNRAAKCGIDIGVRTFATLYSGNECLEIGKKLLPTIDKYYKKTDKLKSDLDNKKITIMKFKMHIIKRKKECKTE